jgi:hypothetical protein
VYVRVDENANERKDINKTMFTPNSKLHAYKVVAILSIPIKIY